VSAAEPDSGLRSDGASEGDGEQGFECAATLDDASAALVEEVPVSAATAAISTAP
jgi:hypothetical protein